MYKKVENGSMKSTKTVNVYKRTCWWCYDWVIKGERYKILVLKKIRGITFLSIRATISLLYVIWLRNRSICSCPNTIKPDNSHLQLPGSLKKPKVDLANLIVIAGLKQEKHWLAGWRFKTEGRLFSRQMPQMNSYCSKLGNIFIGCTLKKKNIKTMT